MKVPPGVKEYEKSIVASTALLNRLIQQYFFHTL
jgi:hypothetical protein